MPGNLLILQGLGHNADCCSNWHISDHTISGRHLQFYTISYGPDDLSIPPLVYATDLSRHGTFWNGNLIGRGHSVLLSDGDELRLGPRSMLMFKNQFKVEKEDKVGNLHPPLQTTHGV